MDEEPPPGFRHPRWNEEQGGFIRRESFGGPVVRPDPLCDTLLILRNHAVCGLVCQLDKVCLQLKSRLRIGDGGNGKGSRGKNGAAAAATPRASKLPQREALNFLQQALREGQDLDLKLMMRATEQMMYALEVLGAWTFIAVRELEGNMAQLRVSDSFNAAGAAPKLLEVLADEGSRDDFHVNVGPGVVLAEPSAATSLMWLYRFLALWFELWREPRPATFSDALMKAYKKTLEPYHGWLVQKTFGLAVAVVPTWAEAREALAAFDPEGEAGMLRNVAALGPLLLRVEDALHREGLWDRRKL